MTSSDILLSDLSDEGIPLRANKRETTEPSVPISVRQPSG